MGLTFRDETSRFLQVFQKLFQFSKRSILEKTEEKSSYHLPGCSRFTTGLHWFHATVENRRLGGVRLYFPGTMRRRIPFFPSPRSSYSLFPEASGDKREATRDGTIGDVSANIRVTSVPLRSNRYSFRCLKSSLKMLHP